MVPRSLHHCLLALQSTRHVRPLDVVGVTEELLDGIENASTCGLDPPGDAELGHGFARDTSDRVDVVWVECPTDVSDPGHLSDTRTRVGCRYVLNLADIVLLDQLLREPAGDPPELELVVFPRVYIEAALGAAERYVQTRTIAGHQGRQCLDIFVVHCRGRSGSCL